MLSIFENDSFIRTLIHLSLLTTLLSCSYAKTDSSSSSSNGDVRSKSFSVNRYWTDLANEAYANKTHGVKDYADRILLHAQIDRLRKKITAQTENLVKQGALVRLLSHYGTSVYDLPDNEKSTQQKLTEKLNKLKKEIETNQIELTDSDDGTLKNKTQVPKPSKVEQVPIKNNGNEKKKNEPTPKTKKSSKSDLQDLIRNSKNDIQQLIKSSKTDIQKMINTSKAEIQHLLSIKNDTQKISGDKREKTEMTGTPEKYETQKQATKKHHTPANYTVFDLGEEVGFRKNILLIRRRVLNKTRQKEKIQHNLVQEKFDRTELKERDEHREVKERDEHREVNERDGHKEVKGNNEGQEVKDNNEGKEVKEKVGHTDDKEKVNHKADIVVSRDDLARLLAGSTNTSAEKLIEFARKILTQTNLNDVMVKKIENSTNKLERIENETRKMNKEELEKTQKHPPKSAQEALDKPQTDPLKTREQGVADSHNHTLKGEKDGDKKPENNSPPKFDPLVFLLSHGELVNHTRQNVHVPKQPHFVRVLSQRGRSMNLTSIPTDYTVEIFIGHKAGDIGALHRQLERKIENETQFAFRRTRFSRLLSETQNVEDDADRLLTNMEDTVLKSIPNALGDAIKLDEETNTSVIVPENTKERFDVTEIEVNQAAHVASYLFSGDLRLLREQEEGMTSNFNDNFHYKYNYDYEVNGNVKFWSGGVIPYTFHQHFTRKGRDVVLEAIAEFREKTCINFVLRRNESNFVSFFHGRGCWSWLGFTGMGEQKVSLQRGSCLTKGNVLHQLMHVLGCGHEHVRADRDEYINIQWDNIRPGFKRNFDIQNNYKLSKKYDYLSVTHYPQSAFAKHQYDYTITVKGKSTKIGQRRQLSELDASSLNNIYCDDTNSIKKNYQWRVQHL